MANERTVEPMAAFYKFTRIGQQVVGLVKRYATGDNGPFVVMEPVLIRDESGAVLRSFHSAAIGLSTDLSLKVGPRDVNKWFSFTFDDTEKTKKGSDKKLFKVLELEKSDVAEYAQGSDSSNRMMQYSKPASEIDDSEITTAAQEDDDLPF